MRILILGTSNSILGGGWVSGLRQGLPQAAIENRSVGASMSMQFSGELGTDFTAYDAVCFDAVINDENQYPAIGPFYLYAALLYEILREIASQTRLVVLGFTNQRHLWEESPVLALYRTLAAELSAEFVSFQSMLASHARTTHRDEKQVYLDEAHPLPAIANGFGRALASALADLPRGASLAAPSRRDCYSTMAANDPQFAGFERRERATSLLKTTMLVLREGQEIALPAPFNMCIGARCNVNNTQAILEMEGESGPLFKEMYYERLEPLQLQFVTMRMFPVVRALRVRSWRTALSHWEESLHPYGANHFATPAILETDRIVARRTLADAPLPVAPKLRETPESAWAAEVRERFLALAAEGFAGG